MNDPVKLVGITKHFKGVTAVDDVTLSARSGEILGILGPSGAGKSTLLRIVDLLETPDKGEIHLMGQKVDASENSLAEVRRRIGMVLQKPVVLNRSVANNLAYSLRIRDWDDEKVRERVIGELRRLRLTERSGRNAKTLSGGEMQRLCFARATIHEPDILLLDEFAANLDPANVARLEQMIRDYARNDSSRCVVMVTHNLFQAKRMCDSIALMWDGKIVEAAPKRKFFENPDDERTAAFVKGELIY